MKRTIWWRQGVLVVPIVLVNIVAVYGQVGWAQNNITRHLTIAVLFAACLESIGVYLAAEAHAVQMAGDSPGKLRLGSYLVALLVAFLNYQNHAGPNLEPTAAACAFGGLSAISPWLWAVRSRSMRRDELRGLGLVDPRAVKFSTARWLLFPRATYMALRAGVWVGTQNPAEALALAGGGPWRAPKAGEVEKAPEETKVGETKPPESTPEPEKPPVTRPSRPTVSFNDQAVAWLRRNPIPAGDGEWWERCNTASGLNGKSSAWYRARTEAQKAGKLVAVG